MVSESVIISDKPKESSASKIKKKVRFNLNVKSYEPLTRDDYDAYLSEGEDEKTGWEFDREERGENSVTTALEFEEDDPIASSQIIGGSSSYPANYRYQNCRSSYGEEDEIELDDDSDFDLDDDDEDENYDDNLDSDGEDDDQKQNSASMESEKVFCAATARLGELGKCKIEQLRDSTDQSTGNKSQIVDSVLNPIENLTQWKAIKAKSRQQQQQQQTNQKKENAAVSTQISKSSCSGPQYSKTLPNLDHSSKAMVQGISVDASLSKWLS